jgi:hypothetical protein
MGKSEKWTSTVGAVTESTRLFPKQRAPISACFLHTCEASDKMFPTRPSFALAFYHLVLLSACQGGEDSADLVLLAPHDSFSFFVLGDWGMGTDVQRSVAESMNTEAQRVEDALFVLNVGDNFYKNAVGGEKQGGVESVDDPLWKEYFEDMYDGSHLKALPFVSILGNHDYMGNFTAQLDFA